MAILVTRSYLALVLVYAGVLPACKSNDSPATVEEVSVGGGETTGATSSSNSSAGGNTNNSTAAIGGRTNSTATTQVGGATNVGGSQSTASSSARGGSSSSSLTTTVGGTANGGSSTASMGGTSAVGGTRSSTTNGGTNTLGGGTAIGGTRNSGGSSPGTTASASGGTATTTVPMGGQSTSTGGSGVAGQPTTPASSTANFPFPQNRRDTKCLYPTTADYNDVQKVYEQWKQHLVTSDGVGSNCSSCRRVKRPAEPGLQKDSTVSEGIAYGMIIAVYMNDQPLFDDLWRYEQAHTWAYTAPFSSSSTPTSLMNWYIAADGSVASNDNGGQSGSGAATDADEDMAWALIMADKQWKGGKGSLSDTYTNYAKKLLADLWKYEIFDSQIPKNGSSWGDDNCLNISYFAPSYYRVFASVSGEGKWSSAVVPKIYSIISASLNSSNGNQDNGLVPAFSTSNGASDKCGNGGSSNQKHWYQYDSCRTPFRIGLDACLNNSSDAIAYVAKTSNFFVPKGAAGIVDGYELNGTEKPEFPGGAYNGLSAAFIGPAAVGAMAPQSGKDYQAFLDEAYGRLRQNNLWTGGQYYDESWTMLALLMLTGNFLDYTKY